MQPIVQGVASQGGLAGSWPDSTPKDLAAEAGITQAYLSQNETGKREGKANVIRALAEAMALAMEDLVID